MINERASIEAEESPAVQWAELSIPPFKLADLKKENADFSVEQAEPLPKSSQMTENVFKKQQVVQDFVKNVPTDDVIFIDTHIIEDDKLIDAVGRKLHDMIQRRRDLLAEVELIDIRMRKYAYFCSDIRELAESEGVVS